MLCQHYQTAATRSVPGLFGSAVAAVVPILFVAAFHIIPRGQELPTLTVPRGHPTSTDHRQPDHLRILLRQLGKPIDDLPVGLRSDRHANRETGHRGECGHQAVRRFEWFR